MDKPKVDFRQEPFRFLCNEAFHGVKSILPASISETTAYDRILAFGLGFAAGYGAAKGLETFVAPSLDQMTGKTVKEFAELGIATVVGGAAFNEAIQHEAAREWRKEHPTYSAGVHGIMVGAVTRGLIEVLPGYIEKLL